MSELEDGQVCKDLWDFSVERGHIDTEKHPIGVLGDGLRSYIAALEAKLEAMERVIEAAEQFAAAGYAEPNLLWRKPLLEALAAAQQEQT